MFFYFAHKIHTPILSFLNPNCKHLISFREKEEKVDIVWNTNSTVSYRRRKLYWFEPEMSVGPLTDTVMTLNLPLVASADSARNNFFMQWGLSDIFQTMEV